VSLITAPGIYAGIDAADYHADRDMAPAPSLSSSGARKLLTACPAVYWYEREHPPEPSEALDVGTAAHEWLLEGETWPQRFTVLPADHSGATKEGKARVAAIREAGKRPLRAEDFATIRAMKAALEAHPFAGAAFKNGRAEQSVYWQDSETGIWCRARPDWLPSAGSILVDYKTCRSAAPEDLRRAIADYGYHQQAAWYCDGVRAVGAIERPGFAFVFQEKAPPYCVVVVALSETALQWGGLLNMRARRVFADCLAAGRWPGYADDVVTLELPAWAEKRLQDQHAAGAFDLANRPLTHAAE
jgi:hypothetical protein